MASPNGVYWVGQDGNVYANIGGVAGGTQSYGAAISPGLLANGFTAPGHGFVSATRVADPNAPKQTTPITDGSGGGGKTTDTTAERADIMAQLGLLGGSLNRGLASESQRYQNNLSGLNNQFNDISDQYNTNTQRNIDQRASGTQTGLLAGAGGLKNLRSVLASMGALGGTGGTLANRAVTAETNKDLSGVDNNYASNAVGLDTAFQTAKREKENQQRELADTYQNNQNALRASNISTQRDLYKDLAGAWERAGDSGQASSFLGKASALLPKINQYSNTQVSKYAPTRLSSVVPDVQSYLAGAQNRNINAQNGNTTGNGLFTLNPDRDRRRLAGA